MSPAAPSAEPHRSYRPTTEPDPSAIGEAVRLLVEALEPELPSYRRSVRTYAEDLPEPPRHGA